MICFTCGQKIYPGYLYLQMEDLPFCCEGCVIAKLKNDGDLQEAEYVTSKQGKLW